MTLLAVVVGAIVVPVGGPPHQAASALPTSYTNPLVDDPSANPHVFAWGQVSYAYVEGRDMPSHANVPAYVSTDLAMWTPIGDVLPDTGRGTWMLSSSSEITTPVGSPAVTYFPDNPADARFVLYFTATGLDTGRRCIGVAAAAGPGGPFEAADDPLICPEGGARDPSPVVLGDGPAGQIVYRQEAGESGIYIQQLAADGQSLGETAPVALRLDGGRSPATRPSLTFVPDEDEAGDEGAAPVTDAGEAITGAANGDDDSDEHGPLDVDAPRSAGGGVPAGSAVLFFSSAAATDPAEGQTARSIGWARCRVAAGLVASCGTMPGAAQWMSGTSEVESPRSPQVFGEGANRWIAYDGLDPGSCSQRSCQGVRRMRVDRLCFDVDGEPRTQGPSSGRQVAGPRDERCRRDVASGWVATWASGLMLAASEQFVPWEDGFDDQTFRQVVHTSIGGSAVRVRVSNTFGTAPLRVGNATVAIPMEAADAGSAVAPETLRPLTFGGTTSVVIPAGADIVSDAIDLDIPEDHDLAISLYLPRPTGPPSGHLVALETSFVAPGDKAADPGAGFRGAQTTTSSFFVSAVDVLNERPVGSIVLLGDSVTDGAATLENDGEGRWSDIVVDRVTRLGTLRMGVVNVGIAGNTLLPFDGALSPAAVDRLDHDVLSQTDLSTVVVLLGINDLMGRYSTGPELIEGMRQLLERSHAAGVRVVGATIPPLTGPAGPPTDAAIEESRLQLNAAMRASQEPSTQAAQAGTATAPSAVVLPFDAVVDFDEALRDPDEPGRMLEQYSWFGGLHPNAAGHEVMADCLDLTVLHD
jgi:lysophospholipase L1-like esterase